MKSGKNFQKYPNRLNLEDGRLAEFFLGKKGMMRNFIIYETEDPQQLLNLQTFWLPEIQYTFIPSARAISTQRNGVNCHCLFELAICGRVHEKDQENSQNAFDVNFDEESCEA